MRSGPHLQLHHSPAERLTQRTQQTQAQAPTAGKGKGRHRSAICTAIIASLERVMAIGAFADDASCRRA